MKESTRDAMFKLDAEIAELTSALIAAQQRRYAVATPVSRLPPEILAAIFDLCAAPSESGFRPRCWFSFAYACRRWRNIAFACPRLWSCPDFRQRPKTINDMLKRSGNYPLSLHLIPSNIVWTRTSTFEHIVLQNNMARIRSYKMEGTRGDLSKVIGKLSQFKALILEDLEVSITAAVRPHDQGDDAILPDDMFQGSAPCLRGLKLLYCSISWGCSLFRGLTVLEVVGLGSHRPRSDLTGILDMLRSTTSLRHLSLQQVLPHDIAYHTGNDIPPVTLPHLTNLYLFDVSFGACSCLLSALSLPISVNLNIKGGRSFPLTQIQAMEALNVLAPAVFDFLDRHHVDRPLRSMKWTRDPTSLEAKADFSSASSNTVVSLSFPFQTDCSWSADFFRDGYRYNWLSQIRELRLLQMNFDDEDAFFEFLDPVRNHLREVKVLAAASTKNQQLFQALERDARTHSSRPADQLLFPGLQRFCILLPRTDSPPEVTAMDQHIRTLAHALALRRAAGFTLEALHIWGCHAVSKHIIELLADSVGRLIADGQTVGAHGDGPWCGDVQELTIGAAFGPELVEWEETSSTE